MPNGQSTPKTKSEPEIGDILPPGATRSTKIAAKSKIGELYKSSKPLEVKKIQDSLSILDKSIGDIEATMAAAGSQSEMKPSTSATETYTQQPETSALKQPVTQLYSTSATKPSEADVNAEKEEKRLRLKQELELLKSMYGDVNQKVVAVEHKTKAIEAGMANTNSRITSVESRINENHEIVSTKIANVDRRLGSEIFTITDKVAVYQANIENRFQAERANNHGYVDNQIANVDTKIAMSVRQIAGLREDVDELISRPRSSGSSNGDNRVITVKYPKRLTAKDLIDMGVEFNEVDKFFPLEFIDLFDLHTNDPDYSQEDKIKAFRGCVTNQDYASWRKQSVTIKSLEELKEDFKKETWNRPIQARAVAYFDRLNFSGSTHNFVKFIKRWKRALESVEKLDEEEIIEKLRDKLPEHFYHQCTLDHTETLVTFMAFIEKIGKRYRYSDHNYNPSNLDDDNYEKRKNFKKNNWNNNQNQNNNSNNVNSANSNNSKWNGANQANAKATGGANTNQSNTQASGTSGGSNQQTRNQGGNNRYATNNVSNARYNARPNGDGVIEVHHIEENADTNQNGNQPEPGVTIEDVGPDVQSEPSLN